MTEAQTPPPGFNFLEADADGTLFAVAVGRASGTKVHVYTGEGDGNHLVVVMGSESNVATVTETFRVMIENVKDGMSHDDARAWSIRTLAEVCAVENNGDGSSCLDETELPPDETESKPAAPVTVLRRRADDVESWTEEKKRNAEAAANSYAAVVVTPKRELKPLPPAIPAIQTAAPPPSPTTAPAVATEMVLAPAFVPRTHMVTPPVMSHIYHRCMMRAVAAACTRAVWRSCHART